MTPVYWVFLAALAALIGAVITAVVTRANAKDTNSLNGLVALNAAQATDLTRMRTEMQGFRTELDGVKADLATTKADLASEQLERRHLGEMLRSAWTHILRLGDQVRGLGGEPQETPPELTSWMLTQDGLVVDRVETTISRTTITDTRTDEQLDLEDGPGSAFLNSADAQATHAH